MSISGAAQETDDETPLAEFTIDPSDNEAHFTDADGEELWMQYDRRQDMLVFTFESEGHYNSCFIEREIFNHALERLLARKQ
jgi:hypothetical protein